MAKYKEWIEPDGLIKIEGWARDGLTDDQIAANMGIGARTLYDWKKKFPQFSQALKKGKEVVDRQVENALLKRALGYKYEETKTSIEDIGGKRKKKIEKVEKHVVPDVAAQIFWLKNRKPNEWRERNDRDTEEEAERVVIIDDIPDQEMNHDD